MSWSLSFEGNVTERNINISGRRDRSRKDFLNQRKREREERELERLRLNSSVIIQSGLSE